LKNVVIWNKRSLVLLFGQGNLPANSIRQGQSDEMVVGLRKVNSRHGTCLNEYRLTIHEREISEASACDQAASV
jgi:hypothetical protein